MHKFTTGIHGSRKGKQSSILRGHTKNVLKFDVLTSRGVTHFRCYEVKATAYPLKFTKNALLMHAFSYKLGTNLVRISYKFVLSCMLTDPLFESA